MSRIKNQKKLKEAKLIGQRQLKLHLQVLQNGAKVVSVKTPLKRRGKLTLTNKMEGGLAIPYYPFPKDQLEVVVFKKSGPFLTLNQDWDGICSSSGNPLILARGRRNAREIPLRNGDYASLENGDLRVMIKVAPTIDTPRLTNKTSRRQFRASFFKLIFPKSLEWQLTLISGIISCFLFGSFIFGLLRRPVEPITRLSEISNDYSLNFISPDHIQTAPEALQKKLEKTEIIRQIIELYENVTSVLMGWPLTNEHLLMSTTVSTYHDIHAQVRENVAIKRRNQNEVDDLQFMKAGVGVIEIPSVVGETMSGSMLRVIDKISIIHDSFEKNLAAKRQMQELFPQDPEYSWEEYKNIKPPDSTAEVMGKIKPFKTMTDEDLVYSEISELAQKAQFKQLKIMKPMLESDLVTANTQRPIAIPSNSRFASFAHSGGFLVADEKLNEIRASEFESKPSPKNPPVKPKEPLIGEIEPEIVEKFIESNRLQLQLCYELALRRNESASGTMEWRWRIDSRGTISELALIASSIKDERMTECIRRRIGSWRFPRPRRGSVEISYPFEFAPTKG